MTPVLWSLATYILVTWVSLTQSDFFFLWTGESNSLDFLSSRLKQPPQDLKQTLAKFPLCKVANNTWKADSMTGEEEAKKCPFMSPCMPAAGCLNSVPTRLPELRGKTHGQFKLERRAVSNWCFGRDRSPVSEPSASCGEASAFRSEARHAV